MENEDRSGCEENSKIVIEYIPCENEKRTTLHNIEEIIKDDDKRNFVRQIFKSFVDTATYLENWRYQGAVLLEKGWVPVRDQFLQENFHGKVPKSLVVLDILKRYDYNKLAAVIVSDSYTINEKALQLVLCFGNTQKGLAQFLRHMLIVDGKRDSKKMQEFLKNLYWYMFGNVKFLEHFCVVLGKTPDFVSIYSKDELKKIDQAIAKVEKPEIIIDTRNWCVLEQVYYSVQDMCSLVNKLLITYVTASL